MCRRRDYKKLSFYQLLKLARRQKKPEEKQKFYCFAIEKFPFSDGDIHEFVSKEWSSLSEENRYLFKVKLEAQVGKKSPDVYRTLYEMTGEVHWLETYVEKSKVCLLIATKLPDTEYGRYAYLQCLDMIDSFSMHPLLDLYSLGGTGQKLLWERIRFLLNSEQGEMWGHTISRVAKITNKKMAIMLWIATLENSDDWAHFLKECPPKWRHLACREAARYYLKLWKKKNLKDVEF